MAQTSAELSCRKCVVAGSGQTDRQIFYFIGSWQPWSLTRSCTKNYLKKIPPKTSELGLTHTPTLEFFSDFFNFF